MNTVMERESVERIGEGLVRAKDLALILEDQVRALTEFHEAQEGAGRAISLLHAHINELDGLLHEHLKLTRQ